MLGPDQINLPVKLNPIIATEATPLRVSHEVGRSLGLLNHQIIKGLVETRGDALGLRLKGEFLELPKAWSGQVGQTVAFKAIATTQGFQLAPHTQAAATQAFSSELLRLWHKPANSSAGITKLMPQIINLAQQLPALGAALNPLILRSQQLSAQSIQNALMASGLFGEARILQGQPGVDIKAIMRQLLRQLSLNVDSQLQLGDAIDELEHRQLETVQAQQRGDVHWHMSLAVDEQPLDIIIQREHSDSGSSEARPWIVDLRTELGALGTVWLNSRLYSTELEIIAWIPNSELASLAERALPSLETQLSEFELSLKRSQIIREPRPEVAGLHRDPGQVLDIST
jgi:hypothetical protein